jgi:hypothetical protein
MKRKNDTGVWAPALVTAAFLIVGCSDDKKDASGGGYVEPAAAELCVSNDCGEVVQLLEITDAENILFSADGRLFVSGGQNVYEVTKDADGAFHAQPLSDSECNFTGLAIHRGHLYASCADSRFFAGPLAATMTLTQIYTFAGMCIPNGTAVGPDGRIYVVDEPLNCEEIDPKIVALTLDPADPMKVVDQTVWVQGSPLGLLWLGLDNVLRFPNGLDRRGNRFFSTDGGSVFYVDWQPDGSAGPVTPIFFEPTAHDDLGVVGDALLVSDFFLGRIFLLSQDGTLLQETDPGTFFAVSSVRLARPPMFDRTDILVTDKGVLSDGGQTVGTDGLYLFRRRPG